MDHDTDTLMFNGGYPAVWAKDIPLQDLEFYKSRYNQGKLPNLYFYRDKSQNEVDLVEENGTGLYAYEINRLKPLPEVLSKVWIISAK